jgi:hypothetical protein
VKIIPFFWAQFNFLGQLHYAIIIRIHAFLLWNSCKKRIDMVWWAKGVVPNDAESVEILSCGGPMPQLYGGGP